MTKDPMAEDISVTEGARRLADAFSALHVEGGLDDQVVAFCVCLAELEIAIASQSGMPLRDVRDAMDEALPAARRTLDMLHKGWL